MTTPTESTHLLQAANGLTVAGCWLSATSTWCDFKLFTVSSWNEEEEVEAWSQIREGEVCDLFDCTEMTASDPVVTGYIKWDGCTEFEIPRDHYCDGAQSVAELHARFQWQPQP